VFWGLPYLQFVPWRHYAWTLLRQGVFPLWNPMNGLGAPLFANYQLALFYPPAFPLFLLDELFGAAGLAWGYTLLIPVHLAWGGVGMVRLLRDLGIRRRGQIVAGLAFSLCGYLVARGSFFNMLWAAVWLPWLLVGIEKVLSNISHPFKKGLWVQLTLTLVMVLLSGHAQVAWYIIVFTGFYTVFRGWQIGRGRGLGRGLAVLAVCGLAAAFMTAVQLWPTYEYLTQSQRANAYAYETAMVYSFSPLRLAGFLIPDLLGNPGYADFVGYATYWEDAVYIGVIPLGLSLLTLFSFRRTKEPDFKRGLIIFLWVSAATGIILSLGSNTAVFPFLYQSVPTFDMFQAPARWMIWPVFSLALLAGIGADQWKNPGKRGRVWLNLAVVGGLMMAAGAAAVSFTVPNVPTGMVRGLIILGVITAAGAFIARRMPADGSLGGWGYAAGILITLDLRTANVGLNPTIPAHFYNSAYSQIEQLPKTLGTSRAWVDPQTAYEISYQRWFDFANYRNNDDWKILREYIVPNTNLLAGVSMAGNFDPLLPARYSTWLDAMSDSSDTASSRWLDRMDVGADLTLNPQNSEGLLLTPRSSTGRFAWTSCAQWVNLPQEAFDQIQKGELDKTCVVLEGNSREAAAPSGKGTVAVVFDTPNETGLMVESDSQGWVIVRDNWFPGWKAFVDGIQVDILHADYLFKAIPVPSGSHQLKLIYDPGSFIAGIWVSLVSWGLVGMGWIFSRKSAASKRSNGSPKE
jgi:hypothetical protein